MTQHVSLPTRGSNILDLILTSDDFIDVAMDHPFLSHYSLSDHIPLTFSLLLFCPNDEVHIQPGQRFSYCKADYNGLREDIRNSPFTPICYSNCDKMLDEWYEWINSKLIKYVPVRTKFRLDPVPPLIKSNSSTLQRSIIKMFFILKASLMIWSRTTLLLIRKRYSVLETRIYSLSTLRVWGIQTVFLKKCTSTMWNSRAPLERRIVLTHSSVLFTYPVTIIPGGSHLDQLTDPLFTTLGRCNQITP